jgi:23S rRNA pseudouridine1911/1915/1917 synthase
MNGRWKHCNPNRLVRLVKQIERLNEKSMDFFWRAHNSPDFHAEKQQNVTLQCMNRNKRRYSRLKVLFEDNHCLGVFKHAGILTVADKSGDPALLDLARAYLKRKYGKPGNVFLGVVHRLDRPVSGVVLFARTSKAAARLSLQFRAGTVRKIYWACVEGKPADQSGTLIDFLVKDRERNVVTRTDENTPFAQRAELEYRLLQSNKARSVLEIRPHTGRSHQIRVQLAAHGLPIVGDVKYGAKRATNGRIALHAAELQFAHPVRDELIRVTAMPPADWEAWTC